MGWIIFVGFSILLLFSIPLAFGIGWVLGELNKTVTGEDQ